MTTSMQLDPQTTALVLIDLEHGIVGLPLAPYPGPEIVTRAARLAAAFREHGATVAYVRVEMSEMHHLPVDQPTRDPHAPPPPPEASQLVPASGYQPGHDLLVVKRQWGALYGTELDQLLRRRGVRTMVLGGIATNFGVESTARAAFDRGYELVFAHDAMTSIGAEAHQFSVQHIFPRMGRVRTADEIAQAFRS